MSHQQARIKRLIQGAEEPPFMCRRMLRRLQAREVEGRGLISDLVKDVESVIKKDGNKTSEKRWV